MTNQVIYAQEVDTNELVGGMNNLWQYHTFKTAAEDVKGNPFLFEEWNTKGIVYSDGKSFNVDKLNYNIYKEEIGTLKEKESVFVYDTQYIDSVKIDNIRLHKLDGKFYEVLQTGSKASLFKKYDTRIVDGMVNNMDGTKQKSRLVIMDDYYVLSGGNLQKFKPSKGALDDIFGAQGSEMKKIMKEKKLSYKKEEDLISIFESYNGI
jgi:hypothetical protein